MSLRVLLTAAPDASGYYRVEQPAQALAGGGDIQPIILTSGLPLIFNHEYDPPRYEGMATTLPDADLIVLQRPMWYFMPAVMRDFQKRGIPVAVEIDDDFHAAHPANRGFTQNHPARSPAQNWHHLAECVRVADHVIVSTDALAKRYGSHGRVSVIRNYATDWWLSVPRRGDGRTLGWPGSTVNHPDDPQAARGAVATVLAEHPDWKFVVIGGKKYGLEVADAFGIRALIPEGRVDMTPWKPLELHPHLVSTIDVGIVPLADTAFNAAKSWLKGLEFAALGIPFVASAMPEYRRLKDEYGIGLLVTPKGRHWRTKLERFIANPDFARDHGVWNRQVVRESLTISKNAWRWAECWQSIASRGVRRAARAAKA